MGHYIEHQTKQLHTYAHCTHNRKRPSVPQNRQWQCGSSQMDVTKISNLMNWYAIPGNQASDGIVLMCWKLLILMF